MSADPDSGEEPKASQGLWQKAWMRQGLALVLAFAGGGAFYLLRMPLAFMLGAMCFTAMAAMAGLPMRAPAGLRPPMAALIGAMLGASFTPDLAAGIGQWIVPMIGLVLFMIASALASVTYLRRVAGYDAKTAYFAGMPGGLADMSMIGEAAGADMRKIAMTHATRVMIIVFSVPFIVGHISENRLPSVSPGTVSMLEADPSVYWWLLGTCVAGVVLGHLVRLPARYILGPMIVSATVHALGWTSYTLPFELVIVAQVVLGAVIGCRFVGLGIRDVGAMLVAGLGSTAILLVLAAAFSIGVSMISPVRSLSLFLAYSPGGFIEMGLVALSIGTDVAFVAAHHAARIMLVGAFAPLVFFSRSKSNPTRGPGSI